MVVRKLSKSGPAAVDDHCEVAGHGREEINSFVDRLNGGLDHHNDFDKDFVMKSCLVLADLPVAYRVENFNNKNLDAIRVKWPTSRRRWSDSRGHAMGVRSRDPDDSRQRADSVPLAYWLLLYPDKALTGTVALRGHQTWLMMCLWNVFGGASAPSLTEVRKVSQEAAHGPSLRTSR